jgi:hypothetical protein
MQHGDMDLQYGDTDMLDMQHRHGHSDLKINARTILDVL